MSLESIAKVARSIKRGGEAFAQVSLAQEDLRNKREQIEFEKKKNELSIKQLEADTRIKTNPEYTSALLKEAKANAEIQFAGIDKAHLELEEKKGQIEFQTKLRKAYFEQEMNRGNAQIKADSTGRLSFREVKTNEAFIDDARKWKAGQITDEDIQSKWPSKGKTLIDKYTPKQDRGMNVNRPILPEIEERGFWKEKLDIGLSKEEQEGYAKEFKNVKDVANFIFSAPYEEITSDKAKFFREKIYPAMTQEERKYIKKYVIDKMPRPDLVKLTEAGLFKKKKRED